MFADQASQRQTVSIHTRHYWRVKLTPHTQRIKIREVSIHTRHYWRVKRMRSWPAGC